MIAEQYRLDKSVSTQELSRRMRRRHNGSLRTLPGVTASPPRLSPPRAPSRAAPPRKDGGSRLRWFPTGDRRL